MIDSIKMVVVYGVFFFITYIFSLICYFFSYKIIIKKYENKTSNKVIYKLTLIHFFIVLLFGISFLIMVLLHSLGARELVPIIFIFNVFIIIFISTITMERTLKIKFIKSLFLNVFALIIFLFAVFLFIMLR